MSIQGQQLKSVLALHQLSFLIKASFDDFCHFRRTVPELQAKLADTAPSAEQQVPAMAVWLLLLDYCLCHHFTAEAVAVQSLWHTVITLVGTILPSACRWLFGLASGCPIDLPESFRGAP